MIPMYISQEFESSAALLRRFFLSFQQGNKSQNTIKMAPRRKKVPTCQFFALQSLRQAVNTFIQKSTTENSCQIPSSSSENNVLAGKFKKQSLLQNGRRYGILEHQIEERIKEVQQYLFHSTPICLCSRLAEMFLNTLQAWLYLNTSNEHTDLTDSMYVGIRLSEVKFKIFNLFP